MSLMLLHPTRMAESFNSKIKLFRANLRRVNVTIDCSASSLPNGSNAKNVLGIISTKLQNNQFNLYPNPVNSLARFHSQSHSGENIIVTVFNYMGQKVKVLSLYSDANGEADIDFNALQVEDGCYTLRVKAGSEVSTFKVLYNAK